MPTHQLKPQHGGEKEVEAICLFGQTNFRGQARRFGIKTDDRRRHMYVIGKTGMGKTTLMENMVLQDIYNGHGLGVVDPHGDFAEKIINYVPPERINDVVYFNPSDVDFPIGFNILEVKNDEQKHLIVGGLMAVFKKIWPDVWSSRMEYILNNTLLALLDTPGSTLLGVNRLLSDKKFRKRVVKNISDPVVRGFWVNEFANYEPRYQKEAVAPIQNKIGQFLSASVIRNMVAQPKSTIDIRKIMDEKKILIMNLSKGRIGEDNSRLLGGMLITQIQLAAMSRVDIDEEDRQDFFLYVDEFQNFATPSFANILSEARKYRLSLIMAHQYVAQLDEVVADAVFGNVGSMVTFRVGAADAEVLAKEYTPTFTEEDIVNLPKFQIFLKLMIDGVASQPFSAGTMPPIGSPTQTFDRVVAVSRERYAKTKEDVAEKIARWSGMDDDSETITLEKGEGIKKKRDDKPTKKDTSSSSSQRGKNEKKKRDEKKQNGQLSKREKNREEKKEKSQKNDETSRPEPKDVAKADLPKKDAEVQQEEVEEQAATKEPNTSIAEEPVVVPNVREEAVKEVDTKEVAIPRDEESIAAELPDVPEASTSEVPKESAQQDGEVKKKRKRRRGRRKKKSGSADAMPEKSNSTEVRPDKSSSVDTMSDKSGSGETRQDKPSTDIGTSDSATHGQDKDTQKKINPDEVITFD